LDRNGRSTSPKYAEAIEAVQDFDALADLRQLQGLCVKMERGGFRPFSLTDLTGNLATLELQCCHLIDQSVEQLLKKGAANKKGLKATAGRGWYGHYIWLESYGCQLLYSATKWSERGLSPIWLRVSAPDWSFPEHLPDLSTTVSDSSWLHEDRNPGWPGIWLPIRLPEGREQQAVADSIVQQVEKVGRLLKTADQTESRISPPASAPLEEEGYSELGAPEQLP
jgi:hypothetical protein